MHPSIGIDEVNRGVGYSIIRSGIIGKGNEFEGTVKLRVQLVCKVCRKGCIPGLICLTAPHGMHADLDHTGLILLQGVLSMVKSCVLNRQTSAVFCQTYVQAAEDVGYCFNCTCAQTTATRTSRDMLKLLARLLCKSMHFAF